MFQTLGSAANEVISKLFLSLLSQIPSTVAGAPLSNKKAHMLEEAWSAEREYNCVKILYRLVH